MPTVQGESLLITFVNILAVILLSLHLMRGIMASSTKEAYITGTNPNLWFQPGQSTFCAAVGAGPAKPYGSPKLPVNPQSPGPAQVDPIVWQGPMPAHVWAQTGGGTFCRPYGDFNARAGVTASK